MIEVQELIFMKYFFPFALWDLRVYIKGMTGTTSNEQKQCSKKLNGWDICTDSYFICFWHEWMREKKLFLCSFHFFLLHFLDLISLPTCHASTHLFYHRNHQNCWDVNMPKSQSRQKLWGHKATERRRVIQMLSQLKSPSHQYLPLNMAWK